MSLCLLSMILANGSSEAVDSARFTLESSSACWFSITKYAGYAVMLGCAMEIPETCILVRDWLSIRFANIERQEDKKSVFIPLSAIGLLVIVLGIALETYSEGKASDIDAKLREHESDKITAAEYDASSAIRDAGTAKDSAITAKDAADKEKLVADAAVAAAGKAQTKVASVSVRADMLDRQEKQLQTNLTLLRPRAGLLGEAMRTKKFIDALRPFASQRVVVEFSYTFPNEFSLSTDRDTFELAALLRNDLELAKWTIPRKPQKVFSLQREIGVTVIINEHASKATTKAAEVLAAALSKVPLVFSTGQVNPVVERMAGVPFFGDPVVLRVGEQP